MVGAQQGKCRYITASSTAATAGYFSAGSELLKIHRASDFPVAAKPFPHSG
jgi:hypothetical protein